MGIDFKMVGSENGVAPKSGAWLHFAQNVKCSLIFRKIYFFGKCLFSTGDAKTYDRTNNDCVNLKINSDIFQDH